MVVAGKGTSFDFKDPTASSPNSINSEVTTNVTAPMVLAQLLIPRLLSLKRSAAFVFVSSGLAFVPYPLFPVYCPTKAAIHTFAVLLRAQLSGTNVRIVELVPPYVDTPHDAAYRDSFIKAQGGSDKAMKPMPLQDFMDEAMDGLKDKSAKEVAVGSAVTRVSAWRDTFDPFFKKMHVDG